MTLFLNVTDSFLQGVYVSVLSHVNIALLSGELPYRAVLNFYN